MGGQQEGSDDTASSPDAAAPRPGGRRAWDGWEVSAPGLSHGGDWPVEPGPGHRSPGAPAHSDDAGTGAPDHPFATEAADRYPRRGRLGQGGMGVVHAVRDRRLGRDVAFKQVARTVPVGHPAARRLAREAWITARLEHPGIVPVYDAGMQPDGSLFFTMRLIRGRTLAELLADRGPDAPCAPLLRTLLAVCEALAFAHDAGVVHRDLKPTNVMVGRFGETQVMDWGVARLLDGPHPDAEAVHDDTPRQDDDGPPHHDQALTGAGRRVGTPAYMSPEQARGAAPHPTADVFSLGVILFEGLTGHHPLDVLDDPGLLRPPSSHGDGEAGRAGRRRPDGGWTVPDPARLVPDLPADLAALVRRATHPRPDRRYATAAGLADDLAAWLDGRPVRAHDYRPWEHLARWVHRRRGPLAVAGWRP